MIVNEAMNDEKCSSISDKWKKIHTWSWVEWNASYKFILNFVSFFVLL